MTIGVVIGRFQTPYLHSGHMGILKFAESTSKALVVLTGVSSVPGSRRDPLDFMTRKIMINEQFPSAVVLPILDEPCDKVWSENIDRILMSVSGLENFIIYGGRDSCLGHYSGKYAKKEIHEIFSADTATSARYSVMPVGGDKFRRGVIYGAFQRYPLTAVCVDIAAVQGGKVLLGVRHYNNSLRFPGGFVEQSDESLDNAASRELQEETGLCGVNFKVLGAFKIDDWRYKGGDYGTLITILYLCDTNTSALGESSEFKSLDWYKIDTLTEDKFDRSHIPLFRCLKDHYVQH